MAVAAYAAVVSLMDLLEQIIQHPAPQRLHLDRIQIETLHEKVAFFQGFLEVHSQRFFEDLEGLARQIAAIAGEAQDIIDAHVVDKLISQSDIATADEIIDSHAMDQHHDGFADKSVMDLSFSCEGIDNVIEKIDSIKKELMTFTEEGMTIQEQGPRVSNPALSLAPPLSGNNTMVGFDEHLVQIMNELTGGKSDLQVLPIVGMGGIGKTTLARNAFDNPHIMPHFDIRTWLTVSHAYSTRGILLGLLEKPGDRKNTEGGESLAKLGDQLHKRLFDRRYLIILDDVWSTDVWNDIRSFFPDNKNGSRIMVTTRLSNVAISCSPRDPYLMGFLDKDKSWNLFCQKAFAKDGCPPELEGVGKSIATSCNGVPLAIVVIGGLLSKSDMTREHWEFVAKHVSSFANSGYDVHCLKIMSLSYNHLPIHLKPCFLYMRVFPEDHTIGVSGLIESWVVEGFLKPIKNKTLEEVAQEYLEDLIGRNLIFISSLGINGKIEACGMHDLLRDLCIRKSQNEHFNCVPKVQTVDLKYFGTSCFLCSRERALTRVDFPRVIVASQPTSIASCLVCDDCRIRYAPLHRTRLVKLLECLDAYRFGWPSNLEVLHPTKLRTLTIIGDFDFVGNLNLLRNLQILYTYFGEIILPCEIWELTQLRHVKVRDYGYLPDPYLIAEVYEKDPTIILKNLQTLFCIRNFKWSEYAIERIPNLKTLGIDYFSYSPIKWSDFSLHNLGHLHELETLSLDARLFHTLKNITFPNSLKNLSLLSCNIPWEEMTIIGSLLNLEELSLYHDAFKGYEWNPIEGQFLRLKSLIISGNSLVRWGAEKTHFPNLERLHLYRMEWLEEIPLGIGEIETLGFIHLYSCTESVVNSAKEILEEQHSLGNEDLQLYVKNKFVLPGSG